MQQRPCHAGNDTVKVISMAPAQGATQIREALPNFQRFEATMQQRPCHAANMWEGSSVDPAVLWLKLGPARPCCSDLVLQHGRGEREQMASSSAATTSKDCLASDKFLIVNVYCQLNVFATAKHILKLERYRED